jgi:hypothetical protein
MTYNHKSGPSSLPPSFPPSFVQVAFAAVEGIFFSGSFCAIFWLKKRGLMPVGTAGGREGGREGRKEAGQHI